MFTVDHSKAQQGRYLAPEGMYECIIKNAKHAETRNGTNFLQIDLLVRDDVQQEGQGETIEWPVWKKREPTSKDPDGFPLGTIQHISRLAHFDNGQTFANLDEWMVALLRKPLRIEIKHEEYQGNVRAKVAYVYETEAPEISLAAQGFVAVPSDEELPF